MASSLTDSVQSNSVISPSADQDVFSLLHRIDRSNCDLLQQVKIIEQHNVPTSTCTCSLAPVRRTGSNFKTTQSADHFQAGLPLQTTGAPCGHKSSPGDSRRQLMVLAMIQVSRGVEFKATSSLEAVRSSTEVSRAVTQLLAYYDEQAKIDILPGKGPFTRRKSGCYNVTNTTNIKPEFKWANEGYIANSNAKKPAYDDMNIAQWVSGQLHNITQVEDPTLVKDMLHQVTFAIRTQWPSLGWQLGWPG